MGAQTNFLTLFGLLIFVLLRDTKPQVKENAKTATLGQAMTHILRDGRFLLFCLASLMVGIVYLMVRSMIEWPDDPAMRAIMGLSAFGLFVGHVGGSLLTKLGPSEAY